MYVRCLWNVILIFSKKMSSACSDRLTAWNNYKTFIEIPWVNQITDTYVIWVIRPHCVYRVPDGCIWKLDNFFDLCMIFRFPLDYSIAKYQWKLYPTKYILHTMQAYVRESLIYGAQKKWSFLYFSVIYKDYRKVISWRCWQGNPYIEGGISPQGKRHNYNYLYDQVVLGMHRNTWPMH